MVKNIHFNFTSYTNEQNLLNKLKGEAINIFGQNMYYIKRDAVDENTILGEDLFQEFKDAYEIVMYPENTQSFDGDKDFLAKFGFSISDKSSFMVHQDEFKKITDMDRPLEGDLIFWPVTKRAFQITFVDYDAQFYQMGKNYVWKLTCELWKYSNENIETGTELDDVKLEYFNANNLDNAPQSDNADIITEAAKIEETDTIDFDPANPFQSTF